MRLKNRNESEGIITLVFKVSIVVAFVHIPDSGGVANFLEGLDSGIDAHYPLVEPNNTTTSMIRYSENTTIMSDHRINCTVIQPNEFQDNGNVCNHITEQR